MVQVRAEDPKAPSPGLLWTQAVRPEGAEALSPGHRPGYNGNQQGALTGRQICVHKHPGRCPGLGASALSGRVGLTCET